MVSMSIAFLVIAVVVIIWSLWAKNDLYPALVAFILLMAALLFYINEKSNRFNDWVSDINLRQVSIVGSDIFERKIRITYQNGKLISITAVPKAIVKIETPEPEKKVEGK